jgi:formate transporter
VTENQLKFESLTPPEMVEKAIIVAENKVANRWLNTLYLAILAGMYIAFGALFASVISVGMPGVWPYGMMKLLQGLVFSMGLILVVVGGAELFTGNALMVMAWARRNITLVSLLKNWIIVYFGNFLGSLLVVLFVLLSKEYLVSGGKLGELMLSVANAKVHYGFVQALVLGILCNIMVCLAVWLTYSGKTTTDKILAIIFPITFFIAAGFEHSVANMYIIPLGILLQGFDPAFINKLSIDLSSLTWLSFLLRNLLPVTLGNILGGGLFVGILYLLAYRKKQY